MTKKKPKRPNQRKIEDDNTGYITQSTRHSMLVSLSREINVISDENAVLYDTIIKLCRKFFPEKNNQEFWTQCKIMRKELMHLILLMIQPYHT